MATRKIAITLDAELLNSVDELVEQRVYPNRSRAIQEAVEQKLQRLARTRLAEACAQLDPLVEQAMAEEGLDRDVAEWPEY